MKREERRNLADWTMILFASLYFAVATYRAAKDTHPLWVIVAALSGVVVWSVIEIVGILKKGYRS